VQIGRAARMGSARGPVHRTLKETILLASEKYGCYCLIVVSAGAGFTLTCAGVGKSDASHPPPSAMMS
jgi:hypothetical protein